MTYNVSLVGVSVLLLESDDEPIGLLDDEDEHRSTTERYQEDSIIYTCMTVVYNFNNVNNIVSHSSVTTHE